MNVVQKWTDKHPDLWEFLLFNLLSNCATITNFVVMWICTGFVFRSFAGRAFHFWIFNYTKVESDLGLCGFLSFLTATACAQTVNFFVQKNLVFKSNAAFRKAALKYILLAVVLVVISTALPAYSQVFFVNIGLTQRFVPTLANVLNIVAQVAISYPAMKFWIMSKA